MSAESKRLIVGTLSPVATSNPREAAERLSTQVVAQVFETPYRAPVDDGPAEPHLFEGPLRSGSEAGQQTYVGRPRAGVEFSNGTPLTAAVVASSLSKISTLADQAEITAQGDEVTFRMRTPNPRLDLALTLPQCGIVLEQGGSLLGTGPFRFAPDATLEAMRLVVNSRYREPVDIEEVVFRVYPAEEDGRPVALLNAVDSGEVDYTGMLSRTDATGLSNVKTSFQPAAATAILYFNTEREAFTDAGVRKALAHAIDRFEVVKISYSNPLALAANSILPSIMGMSHDGLNFDPELSRSLLNEPGRVTPKRLEMATVWAPRPYLPNPQPVAELVVGMLAKLGIEVETRVPGSPEEFFEVLNSGDYDLMLGGWVADTPDPADFLDANLRSGHFKIGPASFNVSRFRSEAMDAALDAFRADPSMATRATVLEIMNKQAPLLPLMYGPNVVVHAWRVRNAIVSPLGVPYFEKFELTG